MLVVKPPDNFGKVDLRMCLHIRITLFEGVLEMVYVVDKNGKPLMPTKRHRKVRLWLKNKKAIVKQRKPFTIQLLFDTTEYVQEIDLGVDSGYLHVGLSAVTKKEEVFVADVQLVSGMKERNEERSSYRKNRRQRLRHRKPRFNNRTKEKGWLAPSVQHKLDSHIRLIDQVKNILPITNLTVEVANFDIQKIMKPDIKGFEYQEGVQKDHYNLREYILHRDGHACQNPACKNKDKNPILVLHHITFRSNGGSDAPWNLITLCTKCHTPKNHKGFLKEWKPKIKNMKPATFMSMVRWRLVNALDCRHTYGYLTKSCRIEYGIEKSHANDAFVIAGGTNSHVRSKVFEVVQVKRNNRSMDKFYDAKYIDARTGEKASGQDLSSGRTTRNKNKNSENLHVYRQEKVSKGRRAKRTSRYPFQPKDLVTYGENGKRAMVIGSQNKGTYVKLKNEKKVQKPNHLRLIKSGKGFCFL